MGVWESIKKESVRTGRGKRGKERKGKKRHGMDGMDGKGREGCTGVPALLAPSLAWWSLRACAFSACSIAPATECICMSSTYTFFHDAEPAALHMRVLVLSKALQCILQGQFQAILQGHTTRAYYRASSGPYYKGILQGHTTGPVPGQG
eukprot:scaffold36863_cov20-Tisochrysis_lutea.AAC.1